MNAGARDEASRFRETPPFVSPRRQLCSVRVVYALRSLHRQRALRKGCTWTPSRDSNSRMRRAIKNLQVFASESPNDVSEEEKPC